MLAERVWETKKARPRASFFDVIPAATYSPTQFPMQYHQLRRA